MDQFKFYKYATWALLLLNIAVLAFFLLTKPKPRQGDFRSEAIKVLNLNSQQTSTFEKLANEHQEKMKAFDRQQQKLLPPYFETLTQRSESIDDDALLTEFQQLEREKIEVTYQHFQDVKLILEKKQLPNFERFIDALMDNILSNKKKGPPPPK